MDSGSILTTFLVVFREALEASLIVGIILTVLARLGQKKYFPHVLVSSLAAIGISILAGIFLMRLTASAQGKMKELIEGVISLAACGVLTYMVFWMDQQSRKIKSEIESQIEVAITRSEYITFITLPFLAIFREGAETVLFLSAIASQSSGMVSLIGSTSGFCLAVLVVAIIFIGGRRVPLKPLFRSTGLLLLFIAAGLLAYGIHELEEFGLVPGIYSPIWNINHILNEKEGVGAFLKSLFGYNGNPSLTEFLSYVAYLAGISMALNRRKKLEALIPTR